MVIDKGIADQFTHCLSFPTRFDLLNVFLSTGLIKPHYKTVQIHTGENHCFMIDQYFKGTVEML